MDFAKVNVEVRNQSGKGAARKARAAGRLPAVLYGHKLEPLSLMVDPLALQRSLDKNRKRNTVFSLTVAGDKPEEVLAMIRDVQIHPLSLRPVHVDFIRVSMEEEVKVTVPLVLTGVPVGVINGGNLHQSLHALRLAAKPDAIPAKIEVDVSALDIGVALHVSDLKLGAGLRHLLDAKEALASVVAPRADKTTEVAVTPVEGATPAAGAAATPAEGAAAAGDKGAAGKAAAGGKKEGGDKKK